MGYGAIIGAIGSIVGGVVQGAMSGGGGGGGGGITLSGVQLDNPNQAGLGAFIGQGAEFPQLTDFTNQVNRTDTAGYLNLLKTLYPGATSQLGQISNLASQYLSGVLPQDVQNQISRATAQQSLGLGGTGLGTTGISSAALGQNIGIASTQLTQLGESMAQGGIGLAKGLIPGFMSPGQLLFSPAQLLQRSDQANYYNTDVKNQERIINASNALKEQAIQAAGQSGGGSGLSSLFGGGGSGGGLGSLLGGGGGGSGGGLGGIFGSLFGSGGTYDLNTLEGSAAYVGI